MERRGGKGTQSSGAKKGRRTDKGEGQERQRDELHEVRTGKGEGTDKGRGQEGRGQIRGGGQEGGRQEGGGQTRR